MSLRIVLIGGGSLQWTPTLLQDLALTPELAGCQIVLHDIDASALDLMVRLGDRLSAATQSGQAVSGTLDRAEALAGADFVIVTISSGGLEAMRNDLAIPMRYGIRQTVGDTVGPGGLAQALRAVPVLVEIARDMERLCPHAWLINYSNPMTALCRAIAKTTLIRTIGLCHELFGTYGRVRDILDLPADAHVQVRAGGINHFVWILDMRIDGKDGLAMLRRYIAENGIFAYVGRPTPRMFVDCYAVKLALFDLLGALPAASDRHICEFVPYFLRDEETQRRYGLEITTAERRYELRAEYSARACGLLDGALPFATTKSDEAVSDIIAALVSGREQRHVVNLPNRGQISNLPQEAVVETLATVGANGVTPWCVGGLPLGVLALVHPHVVRCEMIVDAALTGDRQLALQAMALDPLLMHLEDAEPLLKELLAANARYLPRFWNV